MKPRSAEDGSTKEQFRSQHRGILATERGLRESNAEKMIRGGIRDIRTDPEGYTATEQGQQTHKE